MCKFSWVYNVLSVLQDLRHTHTHKDIHNMLKDKDAMINDKLPLEKVANVMLDQLFDHFPAALAFIACEIASSMPDSEGDHLSVCCVCVCVCLLSASIHSSI